MARWIGPLHQVKAWTEFRSMMQVVEELGAERGRAEERDRRVSETSQQSAIPNLKEIIEGVVAKALSKTLTTASSWAAVAARGGTVGTVQTPRSTIAQAVNGRQPENIVLAVNAAIERDVAVAARRLQSGDTVVTFRDAARPHIEDNTCIQTAFGPDATMNRRAFSIIVKSIPVRLSSNKSTDELLKNLTAANGPEMARVASRKPRGIATYAPLNIGVDNIEAANKLCRDGVVYQSEIFNAEPYYEAVHPRQCYKCHKFGQIAAFCAAPARCGRCSASKHARGDRECGALIGILRECCINCSDKHPSWSRQCPIANTRWNQAREAYLRRLMAFSNPESFDDLPPRGRQADETPPPPPPRGPSAEKKSGGRREARQDQ
ncbi:hypothetical protein E4U61_002280 [Claviceps capensis]|nr:hypothetical protein E4U61_002280 [Claviceps capensis]